ncbi:flavin monoamine oxidase family protein [Leeuwenhoekiella sp. MAR_2009_132]|uniref:flavin monoamine oxidase family protein n=1 Tax=Leeuwenhoekiella sp. MAR_2009_132 TaxID=1392489 RepID=UPI00048B2010|nr:NAD(P)/FAD-dependent oxidoreductase [Leeuwenhoekiella sp. MAR_2009_132]
MILIIGAGLSGLLTGYRLQQKEIPFKILEARDRVGGRIHTAFDTAETPVEMGATWFGDQHTYLIALLKELGLSSFEQYMTGTVFFQPFSTSPAQSIQVPSQPPSYRIAGGTSHLIQTLYKKLDENAVLLNQPVNEIQFHFDKVVVKADDVFEADKVVLALPPKLWSKRIQFSPALPDLITHTAQQTQTWMEDSIKVALTFKTPFWEENKLSGTLFSNTGPITEFYDHCDHKRSKYALCGFMNASFKLLDATERQMRVMSQLQNVFGEPVTHFIEYKECIWSRETHTYESSESPLFPHQNNGNPVFQDSFFEDRLLVSGSETATEFPGYMDGAVYAANETVQKLIDGKNP